LFNENNIREIVENERTSKRMNDGPMRASHRLESLRIEKSPDGPSCFVRFPSADPVAALAHSPSVNSPLLGAEGGENACVGLSRLASGVAER